MDLSAAGASSLKSLDDVEGLIISNFAEDDVLAIEPAGDDGGDEELRSVAEERCISYALQRRSSCLRVWSGVGHGEESRLGVLASEVLIGKLLTVDGLSASTLYSSASVVMCC